MHRRCRRTHAASCTPRVPNFLSLCPQLEISQGCLAVSSQKILRCATSLRDDRHGRKVEVVRSSRPGTASRRQVGLSCRSFARSQTHATIQNTYGSVQTPKNSLGRNCRRSRQKTAIFVAVSRIKTEWRAAIHLEGTPWEVLGCQELRISGLQGSENAVKETSGFLKGTAFRPSVNAP